MRSVLWLPTVALQAHSERGSSGGGVKARSDFAPRRPGICRERDADDGGGGQGLRGQCGGPGEALQSRCGPALLLEVWHTCFVCPLRCLVFAGDCGGHGGSCCSVPRTLTRPLVLQMGRLTMVDPVLSQCEPILACIGFTHASHSW
jgi:hypothetical protein